MLRLAQGGTNRCQWTVTTHSRIIPLTLMPSKRLWISRRRTRSSIICGLGTVVLVAIAPCREETTVPGQGNEILVLVTGKGSRIGLIAISTNTPAQTLIGMLGWLWIVSKLWGYQRQLTGTTIV